LRFIRDYSAGPIQVSDVANALDMTRRSLERKFKQSWPRSINEEILRSRLERAQKILSNSDMTVKTVAEKAGFSSSQRMAQVFRTHLGMSAKEFRECEK
jgi:LacI family transcriptional regulator